MNTFLPADYKTPSGNDKYMKFEAGDNKIRILTAPIIGYELWIAGKPKRIPMNSKWTPEEINGADINTFTGKKKTPVHFWAMAIWNFKAERIQILQINQLKIQGSITALNMDADWGSPLDYDIVINKTGEKTDTKYNVIPKPKKALSEDIKTALKETPVNLNALFSGDDPFSASIEVSVEKF